MATEGIEMRNPHWVSSDKIGTAGARMAESCRIPNVRTRRKSRVLTRQNDPRSAPARFEDTIILCPQKPPEPILSDWGHESTLSWISGGPEPILSDEDTSVYERWKPGNLEFSVPGANFVGFERLLPKMNEIQSDKIGSGKNFGIRQNGSAFRTKIHLDVVSSLGLHSDPTKLAPATLRTPSRYIATEGRPLPPTPPDCQICQFCRCPGIRYFDMLWRPERLPCFITYWCHESTCAWQFRTVLQLTKSLCRSEWLHEHLKSRCWLFLMWLRKRTGLWDS